jgi:hypothetical protein
MVREGTAVPASPKRLDRHYFKRAKIWISGVVDQHRDVFIELLGEIEAARHMEGCIRVGELNPGNAPDDIGTHFASCINSAAPGSRTMPSWAKASDSGDEAHFRPRLPRHRFSGRTPPL